MAHAKHGKAACLDDLRRRILTQELEPGAYLDETQLAEGYAISRPPLREVLRQLAGEGYVVLHPNRGAQVAPMTHKTLRNFFIAAPMIYAAVSRLAAMNARPEPDHALKDTQTSVPGRDPGRRRGGPRVVERPFPRDHRRDGRQRIPDAEPARLLIDHTRISMTFYDPRVPALADNATSPPISMTSSSR
jgi:DNA-binding transcriptional regulator YhcF (GntR family)